MSLNQISVFLENAPGALGRMTDALAAGGIDLRAISLAETKDFGIARIIADDVIAATAILKEADFISSLTPVLAYEIPDESGGLNRLLALFSEAQVNIEYMYSCIIGAGAEKRACMIFRVTDAKTAEKALASLGARSLDRL